MLNRLFIIPLVCLVLLAVPQNVQAWLPVVLPSSSLRLASTELYVRRGKSGSDKSSDIGESRGMGAQQQDTTLPSRWCKLPAGQSLPEVDNQVGLMETNLPTLKDQTMNPNGAVSVLRYDDNLYCFSVSCPCCKIPLTKAKVVSNNDDDDVVALQCDFCKSMYNLNTGQKLKSEKPKGIMGGLVNTLLSANSDNNGPMPLYQLGEDANGNLVIDPSPRNPK